MTMFGSVRSIVKERLILVTEGQVRAVFRMAFKGVRSLLQHLILDIEVRSELKSTSDDATSCRNTAQA